MDHKNSAFHLIAVQYQLSRLIGQDLDLNKMLSIFVPKMLKIINGIGGYIWIYDKATMKYEKAYFYPAEIINQSTKVMRKIGKLIKSSFPLALTSGEYLGVEQGTHSYILPIGEIGFMLLEFRENKLSDELLLAMKPVLQSLATACVSCLHYFQIESRYHGVFENSPVALIEQDYSELKHHLNQLKKNGIDLRHYFESHSDALMECIKMIKMDNANRATLDLFSAKDLKHFASSLDKILVLNTQNKRGLMERLIAISNNASSFQHELQFVSLTGRVIDAISKYTVIPGYEDYSRVLHSIFDITEMKQAQNILAYSSTHDALTGLANRGLYHETLLNSISRVKRTDQAMALMYLDLDYFKNVNDTFGHQVGDLILIEFGSRIQKVIRQDDLVARLGGDEFAIILNGLNSMEEANEVAARLVALLAMPYYVMGHEIILTVSIGTAMCPQHAVDVTDLNHYADLALYQAKHLGRNKHAMYISDKHDDKQAK